MQFRVRPSSKKSNNNDVSLVQFPTIRSMNQGDSSMSRPLASKLSSLQSTLSTFQQLYRRDRQIDNASVIEVQKRLDKLEYKMFSAQQEIRQLSDIRDIKMARETYSYDNSADTSKNQIALLRQALLQERQAQKESLKHQNNLIEQLSLKQLRAEQQFRQMIGQQRMDYQYRLNDRGQQLKQIQDLKQRKVQQQYELMKGIISKAERNIYQQLQRKIQNQTIMKDYIESRFQDLKQEMIKEHKQVVSTEAKFVRETKMSLQSLFGFISGVKREFNEEIAETQKLSVKAIQNLSNNFDSLHRRCKEDLKNTINSQNQLSNELVELRNFIINKLDQNRQFLSQFQSQIIDKLSNSGVRSNSGARSNSDTQRTTIDSQRFSLFQKQINQWKSITQQKNLNVFKEISNTLKTIKQQWRKQNDDLVSQVSNLNDSLNNIKKNGPLELKKNIQTLITIFNNQFDILAEELQSMTELISLAKKENQKNVKQQLHKNGLEVIGTIKVMINDRIRQANNYTDKSLLKNQENFKSIMQKQIKYSTQSINKHLQKNDEQLNSLQSTIKKNNLLTVCQLQDFSMKLKVFNDSYKNYLQQTRKQQLRKRNEVQQAMRKNASNLMDICYKKSELLVESLKKSIETSQMKQRLQTTQSIQNSKDEFKKEIQVTRLEWQKQLAASTDKLTKDRENSEEILHEAVQQSILNVKVALANQIGALSIDLEQKISDIKLKQLQSKAQEEKEKQTLNKQVEKLLEAERKAFQSDLTAAENNLDNKIKDQDLIIKKQKTELEELINKSIHDATTNIKMQSEQNHKKQTQKQLQFNKKQQELNSRIAELTNQVQQLKKMLQQIKLNESKNLQQANRQKDKQDKISEQSLNKLRLQLEQQIRKVKVLIEQLQARIQNYDQQQTIEGMKKNINKLQAMTFSEQAKNKAMFDRINEDINKITDNITLITNQMSQ